MSDASSQPHVLLDLLPLTAAEKRSFSRVAELVLREFVHLAEALDWLRSTYPIPIDAKDERSVKEKLRDALRSAVNDLCFDDFPAGAGRVVHARRVLLVGMLATYPDAHPGAGKYAFSWDSQLVSSRRTSSGIDYWMGRDSVLFVRVGAKWELQNRFKEITRLLAEKCDLALRVLEHVREQTSAAGPVIAARTADEGAAIQPASQSAPERRAPGAGDLTTLPPGDWLMPPLSLAEMANRLDNITPEKARPLLEQFRLRNFPPGNRQSWTVDLSLVPERMREQLRGKSRPN